MMWNDVLTTLNTYGTAIQTIVLLVTLAPLFVTLIYFARQTRQLGRQLELTNITSRGVYFNDLDKTMLGNAQARKCANIPIESSVAHLWFGVFKARYLLHEPASWKRLIGRPSNRTILNLKNFSHLSWAMMLVRFGHKQA